MNRRRSRDVRRRPVPLDAALRETVALLELVRREEVVLGRLAQAVTELEAIRRARATLADRTMVELDEAIAVVEEGRPSNECCGTGRGSGR